MKQKLFTDILSVTDILRTVINLFVNPLRKIQSLFPRYFLSWINLTFIAPQFVVEPYQNRQKSTEERVNQNLRSVKVLYLLKVAVHVPPTIYFTVAKFRRVQSML